MKPHVCPNTGEVRFTRVRTALFNYDTDQASRESGLRCLDRSLAQQSMKEEADINTIVRRFGITGDLPQAARLPAYGDFEGIFDYQTAQNAILRAQASFKALPADVREAFRNDPREFVEFATNPENLEDLREMGLAPPAQPAVQAAPIEPPKPA